MDMDSLNNFADLIVATLPTLVDLALALLALETFSALGSSTDLAALGIERSFSVFDLALFVVVFDAFANRGVLPGSTGARSENEDDPAGSSTAIEKDPAGSGTGSIGFSGTGSIGFTGTRATQPQIS